MSPHMVHSPDSHNGVQNGKAECNEVLVLGQNFAMACEQYGEKDKITILQFVGGMTGKYIQSVLEEKGIHQINVPVGKGTRTCTTVLDKRTGAMTELIEPAGRVSAEERSLLESRAMELLKGRKLEAIALCGSLPPGITGSTYTLVAENKPAGCTLLLDACDDIDCLKTGNVDILKINAEEAAKLAGRGVDDEVDLLEIGVHLASTRSIPILAITNGPDEAYLFDTTTSTSSNTATVTTYTIPNILNVVGGDEHDLLPISTLATPMHSPSLPEETGESIFAMAAATMLSGLGSSTNSVDSNGNAVMGMMGMGVLGRKDVVLNPLGAGDTCSGVFLMEYLDTRDACQSFRQGLAAASASCLVIDYTSHFDISIMKKIFERITYTQRTIQIR
ncbi:hypothetical protein HK104_004212 [Borealophlyctis nickersoniae]|nr:hypothetical protein HK104_004212 [Borealophlyctis nickersoniae]